MTKIVVFGESVNDSTALKELVVGICPSLQAGDVKVLREPPTLQRGARAQAVDRWAEKARQAIVAARIAASGGLVCALVHCDADGPDDGTFMVQRTRQLRALGVEGAHAVVPVMTIEAWWLLHPRETESVVKGWRGALVRRARDVDRIADPKAELRAATERRLPRRPYVESDSPAIAAAIARAWNGVPPPGSASFQRFVDVVKTCCARAG